VVVHLVVHAELILSPLVRRAARYQIYSPISARQQVKPVAARNVCGRTHLRRVGHNAGGQRQHSVRTESKNGDRLVLSVRSVVRERLTMRMRASVERTRTGYDIVAVRSSKVPFNMLAPGTWPQLGIHSPSCDSGTETCHLDMLSVSST
jgi:hypothetical protein